MNVNNNNNNNNNMIPTGNSLQMIPAF